MTGVYSFQAGNVVTLYQLTKTNIVVGVSDFVRFTNCNHQTGSMIITDLVRRSSAGGYLDCGMHDILRE